MSTIMVIKQFVKRNLFRIPSILQKIFCRVKLVQDSQREGVPWGLEGVKYCKGILTGKSPHRYFHLYMMADPD